MATPTQAQIEAALKNALLAIKHAAYSDRPCEELKDAQADLREIYAIADAALEWLARRHRGVEGSAMTAPTQAQIEAAAWEIVRGGGHTVPPDEARIIAKAAITAAAEVGEPSQTNMDIAREFCRESVQHSFGLTDERTKEYAKVIAELLDYACAATIERCAEIAENMNVAGIQIAAAIRALGN